VFTAKIIAQNVEFQLGGKTNAEKFEITDSDGKVIFQLKGNGKIGLGSAVLKSAKMHVQGSINSQGVYKIQGSTVLSKKGTYNTFVGEDAGMNNPTSTWFNTFTGYHAGYSNTIGWPNSFFGYMAGNDNTEGGYNTFVGSISGRMNTTGSDNTYVGEGSGRSNTSGNHNTFVGKGAGYSNTTSDNSFFGYQAGALNTSGAENTFIGTQAGYANTLAYGNTFTGYLAGTANTGSYNTFTGSYAGLDNTTGYRNTFNGRRAGENNTTGYYNTFIGYGTGHTNTTGIGNVFLGYYAGRFETGSNLLYVDNSDTGSPLIWGDFSNNRVVINGNSTHNTNSRTFFSNGAAGGTGAWINDSDGRMKKNITTIDQALDKVQNLRGVNFEWKETEHHEEGLQMGFIAQEVEEVIPEVVSNGGDSYSMQYSPLTALLVEAVKEQQQIIEELRNKNNLIEERLESIESLVQFTYNQ
jgi:hypothetical protein